MALPDYVTIYEVSPRDGLQNEKRQLPTEVKVIFIDMLSKSGLPAIEVASCVPPARVPQMADSGDVFRAISKIAGTRYPVLVPNLRGLQDGLAAGAREVSVIASASESFSQNNSNCSIEDGLARCAEIQTVANEQGVPVRGYLSCVLGCPFEREVPIERVVRLARSLYEMGLSEVVLSDTIGVGTAAQVQQVIAAVAAEVPITRLAVHFHDTYGQALANILAALQLGIATVDSSVAGLGGCPYARGATGNVASEDLIYMLNGLGIETGVDLKYLVAAGDYISKAIVRQNGSRVAHAVIS